MGADRSSLWLLAATPHPDPKEARPDVVATDVPPAARGPAIDPARGWLVEEIRDGAYWVTDGDYQALLVTSAEGVAVIDAPRRSGHSCSPPWRRCPARR
jgi:hypothetical protein